MQTSLDKDVLQKVDFLTGSVDEATGLLNVPARAPFNDEILDFLNDVSRVLMNDRSAKRFSDVYTFAFWIRKASTSKLKERFEEADAIHHGRGVVFHIAPSNVPVNFAYSLVAGLLNGNANVVRVPSKDFEQVSIIARAFNDVLKKHENIQPYVLLVRYGREKDINDLFSSVCDVRVVWGGDATITELRKSPLSTRSSEVTFADRYSLAVIDSDMYLSDFNKERTALDFYNDTFFSDQNACTSPRIVVWTGSRIDEAKRIFWDEEHKLVKQRYVFQPIQAVNKLTSAYLAAVGVSGCVEEKREDNLIIRIRVPEVKAELMDYRDNSGFFFEYDCNDILEIKDMCDDKHCQTIGYIGNKDMFVPLIQSGIKGVDRIVPIGKTMDFNLIWDGYDLPAMLTRTVVLN